jgi:hypothetical protein
MPNISNGQNMKNVYERDKIINWACLGIYTHIFSPILLAEFINPFPETEKEEEEE